MHENNVDTFQNPPIFCQSDITKIFDAIAKKYDFLNHLLSFCLDFHWRSEVSKLIRKKDLKYIDLATGTGDILINVMKKNPQIQNATGLDTSENMLGICNKKISKQKLKNKTSLILADITRIPLNENSFDAATVGFGIRNTNNIPKALSEIHRILKPQGHTIILEFFVPQNQFIKTLYLLYLRHIVPLIAGICLSQKSAYVYLNKTIEKFYSVEQFRIMMKNAGFINIKAAPLAFGTVYIYHGYKK